MFDRILRHTPAYGDLIEMRKKLNRVTALNYELMPSILPLHEKSRRIFSKIESKENSQNLDFQISKDDLMFQFWLHHVSSVDDALWGYFSIGYKQATSVKDILKNNFSDITNLKLLDFASGHGRISRYFKNFLPIENITISDIKQQAVNFQKEIFHYKGFPSAGDPNLLICGENFDFILVSSLFTHLNKQLFSAWLKKLGSLIRDKGILSLSLHIINDNKKEIFNYSERSEEDIFPETSENLAAKNIYGLTTLNHAAFHQLVFENLGSDFQIIDEREWGDSQILISIQKLPTN